MAKVGAGPLVHLQHWLAPAAGLLTVTAKGQVTLRQELLRHLGVKPGEQIVREGPANYYHGPMAHGGWLVLSNRRLVFRPHFFNLRWADTVVHVGEIAVAEAARTLWVLPNKLKVSSDRDDHHFVVEQSPAWVAAIDAQR